MPYYLSYIVSYAIITLFLLKSIDKIANNQSKVLQALRTDHDRSKDHLVVMLMLSHRAKEAVLLDCVVRAGSRTGSNVLALCYKTAD